MSEYVAYDYTHESLVLYVRFGMSRARESSSIYVYIPATSLVSAQVVDADGMVEVTLREGKEDWETFGDGSTWFVPHTEYKAKFPHAFLVKRGLEAGNSNILPHLPDLHVKPIIDLSQGGVLDIQVFGQESTQVELEEHIHVFSRGLTWLSDAPPDYDALLRASKSSPEPHTPYRVRLTAVKLKYEEYCDENRATVFHRDTALAYMREKNHEIIRPATLHEGLALAGQYDTKTRSAFFLLNTEISCASCDPHYPLLQMNGHVRKLDLFRDRCGYGGYGDTYILGVLEEDPAVLPPDRSPG